MDLRSRIKQMEQLDAAVHLTQASSLSPLRPGPVSHLNQTATPLRGGATPRTQRAQNPPLPISFKPKSPALSQRSDDTVRSYIPGEKAWSGDSKSVARSSELEALSRLLVEKDSACISLSRTVEQLKSEVSEKCKQITELRSIIGSYEGKLKTYFAKDYEKLLVQKDVQIQQLEDENKRFREKLDQETQKLSRLLMDGDRKLSEVRQQIVVLIKKNQELESQRGSAPLYEVLQKFQRENKILSEKLQSQAAQTITQEQYQSLETQFHAIEDMQNRVIGENSTLKSQLEDSKQVESALLRALGGCFSWLLEAQSELQQLLIVVKTVSDGSQIDLKMLLDSASPQAKRTETGSVEQLSQMLAVTKTKLGELKTLLLEVYTEHCTQDCAVH